MAVDSFAELFEVLGRGDVDRLISTAECEWLDFKDAPYHLDSPRGIRDLLADVASFANGVGGAILIGVRTEKLEGKQQELASEIRGVRSDLVKDDQIRGLVRSHIHPLVQVDIRRYQLGQGGNELVALLVNAQADHERPCVVDRAIDVDGSYVAHAVGWPTRHGADTHWETAGRIQQLIATGLRPGVFPAAERAAAPVNEAAEEQLDLLDVQEGWEDWPRIIVQAIPDQPSRLVSDFFGEFIRTVNGWHGVRPSGFDLGLDGGGLRPVSSHLVVADEGRFVAMHRSGVMTAAANGTPDMLGWAVNRKTPWDQLREVVANPYVVVEFVAEAVRFAGEVVAPEVVASGWTYRVIGQRLTAPTPLVLRPKPRQFGFPGSDRRPSSDSFRAAVTATGDTWRDAFEAVAEIYGVGYGLGRSDVPWAKNERIDLGLMST